MGTLLNLELRSICFVCVNCFVLLSGYFGIRWRLSSFLNLLFQILFWSIVTTGIYVGFNNDMALSRLLPMILGNWTAWFVVSYLGLYLLSPILNAYLEKASDRQLLGIIGVFYVFSTLFGWIAKRPDFNDGMSTLSLMGLYLIGAYLRRMKDSWKKLKAYTYLAAYFSLGVLLLLLSLIALYFGVTKSVYGYLNPIVILESVCLFLFFAKLNIGHIKWINGVAASAFSVYLFHFSPALYPYYQKCCAYIEQSFTTGSLVIGFLFMTTVFITAVTIDRLRILLFNCLQKCIA